VFAELVGHEVVLHQTLFFLVAVTYTQAAYEPKGRHLLPSISPASRNI
jgi:hypothetical protein